MWVMVCGFIALFGAFFIGATAEEMFMIALLAMCYAELCEIKREVGK